MSMAKIYKHLMMYLIYIWISLYKQYCLFGNTCIIRSSQAAIIYSIHDKSMTSRIPYVPWTYPSFKFNDKESFRHICIYYSEYESTN